MIKPLKDADKGEDELILAALSDGVSSNPKWDEKALAALKSRGLVTSSKSKEWRYIITEAGQPGNNGASSQSVPEQRKRYWICLLSLLR